MPESRVRRRKPPLRPSSRPTAPPRPEPAAVSDSFATWRFWALATIILALLILRRPDCVTNPQFWAEDGALLFRWQVLFGFWTSVMSPYNGYLCVLQRIIAAFVTLFPVLYAPLAYALIGSAIEALCCAIFVLPAFRHILRSDGMRAAVCVLTAILLPADELVGTVVNTSWYLLLAGTLLVFRGPSTSNSQSSLRWAAWGLLGLFLPLTTPVLILCVPFCLWNILRSWRPDRMYEVGLLAGLGVQLWIFAVARQSPANLADPAKLRTLAAAVVGAFVYRAVLSLMIGYKLSMAAAVAKSAIVPWAAIVATAAWLSWVWWKADRRNRWKIAIVLYVAVSSLAITLGGRNAYPMFAAIRDFRGFQLERYLFLAGCAFVYLMAVSIEVLLARQRVPVRIAVLAAAFVLGVVYNYKIPAFADKNWRGSARVIQTRLDRHEIGKPHPPIVAPILPEGWAIILD